MFGDMGNLAYDDSLPLRNTNGQQLFNVWIDDTPTVGWGNKERTLAEYISEILLKEYAEAGKRERVTDSFVNFLLGVLEFNEYPFSLRLKADFDEDKHIKNVDKLTWWGEFQIAGELYVNHLEIKGRYYVQTLFAIRVIGTRFTFYKAEIGFNYLNSLPNGFPGNSMYIYRYPGRNNQSRDDIPCLDYTDPN
ncbi:4961_t:CDS:2 [Entrophospora sp. SA101]|nr:4961_t:CDS:2 [Entrophospora sp. SA101]CAJ0829389.1 11654_t:CDS:2 [Entrophospora sp. SA101]